MPPYRLAVIALPQGQPPKAVGLRVPALDAITGEPIPGVSIFVDVAPLENVPTMVTVDVSGIAVGSDSELSPLRHVIAAPNLQGVAQAAAETQTFVAPMMLDSSGIGFGPQVGSRKLGRSVAPLPGRLFRAEHGTTVFVLIIGGVKTASEEEGSSWPTSKDLTATTKFADGAKITDAMVATLMAAFKNPPAMHLPGMEPLWDDEAPGNEETSAATAKLLPCTVAEYLSPLHWRRNEVKEYTDAIAADGAARRPALWLQEIIPIGGDCATAQALRFAGLRNRSHPFDWMRSHPGGIASLITSPNAFEGVDPFDAASTTTIEVVHVARDTSEYVSVPSDGSAAGAERFWYNTDFGFLATKTEAEPVARRLQRLMSWTKTGVWDSTQADGGYDGESNTAGEEDDEEAVGQPTAISLDQRKNPNPVLLLHIARTSQQGCFTPEEVSVNGTRKSTGASSAGFNVEAVPTEAWTKQRWADLEMLARMFEFSLQQRVVESSDDPSSVIVPKVLVLAVNLFPFPCSNGRVRNVVAGIPDSQHKPWESMGALVAPFLKELVDVA